MYHLGTKVKNIIEKYSLLVRFFKQSIRSPLLLDGDCPYHYYINVLFTFMVVRLTVENAEAAVELFYKDEAHHLVREGHL